MDTTSSPWLMEGGRGGEHACSQLGGDVAAAAAKKGLLTSASAAGLKACEGGVLRVCCRRQLEELLQSRRAGCRRGRLATDH